jgi:hypothetical protein
MKVDAQSLEKYSSAVTLSDMEIFVFPELLYALVLANAMSPRLWAWRDDPWFARMEKLTPYRRILRLKQYVIDRYEFNLDLDTWGLTTKGREVARFRPWMDEATLSASNALFGYEGDKYYFDIDIRRHFGLDKYEGDVIPYWKTETLEAMDAFRHRPGYRAGAGECVSLSTLYAAAVFVVCGVPLRDIFLLATPLHSQNFICAGEGVLTNNRRVVTRNMWFNGTELTGKAQRALRHEQVTLVAHHTGHVHCVYPEATIDPAAYERFRGALRSFLSTDITAEILASFLRQNAAAQSCFQFSHERHGRRLFIPAEKVYAYEASSNHRAGDASRARLLAEIDEDEFFAESIEGRLLFDAIEESFRGRTVRLDSEADVRRLMEDLHCDCVSKREAVRELLRYARLEPRWPDAAGPRRCVAPEPIDLDPAGSREEIVRRLESLRGRHPVADLAFYAHRDLARTDWAPFFKAALERNPVSVKGAGGLSDDDLAARLRGLTDESIYDGARAAQPDEVWNFGRGDGFERALCLLNVWKSRHPSGRAAFEARGSEVVLLLDGVESRWPGAKGLTGRIET